MWRKDCRNLEIILFSLIFILVIVININIVSCKNISVNYPEEVDVKEEFNFEIELIDFSDDNYDIKIDVNENNRIAQIWNGDKWQSTFKYVKSAIDSGDTNAILKLKIFKDYEGEADIVIKIRKNSENSYDTFSGYKIEVKPFEEDEAEETKEDGRDEEEETEKDEEDKEDLYEKDEEDKEEIIYEETSLKEKDKPEVIYLNQKSPQNLKTDDENNLEDKDDRNQKIFGKMINYSIYFFILLLIVVIYLKVKQRKKEEII